MCKITDRMANSEDQEQFDLGLHCLFGPFCTNISHKYFIQVPSTSFVFRKYEKKMLGVTRKIRLGRIGLP